VAVEKYQQMVIGLLKYLSEFCTRNKIG